MQAGELARCHSAILLRETCAGGMTGVGAETLVVSAGGYSDGDTGVEGSDTISGAGWVGVAF
jgi:hypothetical protein